MQSRGARGEVPREPAPRDRAGAAWQQREPRAIRAKLQEYAESGKKKVSDRKSHLKRKYGLTLEAFDALLASQGGGCAICGRPTPTTSTTTTTPVACAGILCFNCNVAIGQLDDDEERALSAAAYLARDDELTAVVRERGLALSG